MYLTHYGLNQSPFGITPNPAFFYTGNKRGAILDALIYAVTHGEGIIKVTGEVGSGKTMLCRMLESMLPENVVVIYLVNPTLSREEVVYAIAGELGLATGGKRPDEVIRLLQSDLIAKHINGKQVVLLVEEAQAMPLDTLEEIRLFSNLETAHHKLLQIVLFGQPELDENLNLARMRQLKERITHSFKVPPMESEVIPEFLMFRMRAAGYHGPDIFSKGAVKLISAVSEGVVRRISILADKSLLAAFAENTHLITAKHVKAAVQDSEFSYAPTTSLRRNLAIASGVATLGLALLFMGWKFVWPQTKEPVMVTATALPVVTVTTIAASAPAAAAPPVAAATEAPMAEKPAAPMVTTPASADNLLKQKLTTTKAWLSDESTGRYSIQLTLMAADNRVQLDRFLSKIKTELDLEQIYIYPTRVGGTARFAVLYGHYLSRDEATAVGVKLFKEWGYHAQLRTIPGIKEEINKSNSADLWQ